jgi:hypothetical protein
MPTTASRPANSLILLDACSTRDHHTPGSCPKTRSLGTASIATCTTNDVRCESRAAGTTTSSHGNVTEQLHSVGNCHRAIGSPEAATLGIAASAASAASTAKCRPAGRATSPADSTYSGIGIDL